jgi:hypothetical protein
LGPSPYADAMKFAVMTDPKVISGEAKKKYALLVGKYIR